MDIDEARGVLKSDPYSVDRHVLVEALHAFQRYNDDALETLADRDSRIDDLEAERDAAIAETGRACEHATARQAVIDGHGEALRGQRRTLLKEAEKVKVERDKLRTRVGELEAEKGRTSVDRAWLVKVAGLSPDSPWTLVQGYVSQAFADQRRWRALRNKVTELDKLTDGDRITGDRLTAPGTGFTFTMGGPFRSYYLPGDRG